MKSEEKNEWCIALDNINAYHDPILGTSFMFLKGERATKEKVFSMIPEMTEEKYAELFRPATEEEINGEFDWDGYQYILKKETKRMKSIKEKAIEVFPRHCNTNTDSSNFKKRIGFNSGANYVLDVIEEFMVNINLGNNSIEKFYKFDLIADIHAFIEQLKGNQ